MLPFEKQKILSKKSIEKSYNTLTFSTNQKFKKCK
jgi:hypothetical protein